MLFLLPLLIFDLSWQINSIVFHASSADEVDMTTMRTTFYLPLGLAVGGMLFYHLGQKSIPKEINPFYATIIAYVAGIFVLSIFAFTLSGKKTFFCFI